MFNSIDLSTIPTEQLEKELQLRKPKFDIKQQAIGKERFLSFYWIDEGFTILVDENAVKFYPSVDTMKNLADWINGQLNRKATPEPIARKLAMEEIFNTSNIGDDTDMVWTKEDGTVI